jgi:chaperonin GroEL (HSP60 family)
MDRRSQDELLEVLDALRKQVGPNGIIVPLGSRRYHPSAVVVAGYVYPLELVARTFADPETGHADLSSPAVLVCESALVDHTQLHYGLAPVLKKLVEKKPRRSLAVFAPDMDGAVLEALVDSHRRNLCTVAAVGCAGMEPEAARHYLHIIAHISAASVVDQIAREGPAWTDALGSAGRILVDRRRAVIIEPEDVDQTDMPRQSIGLLSVGGTDVHSVQERIEWIEGILGN